MLIRDMNPAWLLFLLLTSCADNPNVLAKNSVESQAIHKCDKRLHFDKIEDTVVRKYAFDLYKGFIQSDESVGIKGFDQNQMNFIDVFGETEHCEAFFQAVEMTAETPFNKIYFN